MLLLAAGAPVEQPPAAAATPEIQPAAAATPAAAAQGAGHKRDEQLDSQAAVARAVRPSHVSPQQLLSACYCCVPSAAYRRAPCLSTTFSSSIKSGIS